MCPKIVIHPFLYVLVFLLLVTGKIKPFIIFMSLILIHELGHFITAKLCGWKTEKIELYPYGGISKFQTFVNVPIPQEFLVLMMGPITQMIFAYSCSFFLSIKNLEILTTYHQFLLWFNLLPIYPLDGGKLVHLLCSKYLSFQKSFYTTIWISYGTILLLGINYLLKHFIFFVGVLILLLFKISKEKKQFPYIFHKFLIERVLYSWNFKRKIVIKKESEMKKDTYHFFKKNKDYYGEKEYLSKFLVH